MADTGTTPSSSPLQLSGIDLFDAMTHGFYWVLDPTHTINFAVVNSTYASWPNLGAASTKIGSIFAQYEQYIDVRFHNIGTFSSVEGARQNGADIVVTLGTVPGVFTATNVLGRAFFPYTINESYYPGAPGDIWLNASSSMLTYNFNPGSVEYFLVLHELGHALGLKHPHDSGGTGRPTFAALGIQDFDMDWATVMSYEDDYEFNTVSWDPITPMLLDVFALQALYGPNLNTNAGNDRHNLVSGGTYQVIWDPSGNDTLTVSGESEGWTIWLEDGVALPSDEVSLGSPYSFYWLLGEFENVTGTAHGDDIGGDSLGNALLGLGGNDVIDAGPGNDILNGGAGADLMVGGDGSDVYYVDNSNDVVYEDNAGATGGNDVVCSYLSAYTLPDFIEYGRVLATGGASLTGNGLVNVIYGGPGNDTLSGLGGGDVLFGDAGADTMIGGDGNDIYYVGDATDVVTEANATPGIGGNDVACSYVADFTLPTNVEYGILLGGAWINDLSGNVLNNVMYGNGNNNLLAGRGGIDVMVGLGGNDIFRFDTAPNDATNYDILYDFNVVDDTIQLENAIFASLTAPGTLSAANFCSGAGVATAQDGNDFVIYNSSSGALYYDADGSGGGATATLFAFVPAATALTASDFVVN